MGQWNRLFFLFLLVQTIVLCNCTPAEPLFKEPPKPTFDPQKLDQTESSSLIINVINNLGYGWYPKNDKLCKMNEKTGLPDSSCKGGLACLSNELKKGDVPLFSAGNTLTDSTAKTDLFKAIKFVPATKALNFLKSYGLNALVMGPDLYRYGGSLANKFAESLTDINKIACNLNSTDKEAAKAPYKSHVDVDIKGKSCGIRVIGFANANITRRTGSENIHVLDEVESISRTIASAPRGNHVIIVMGEGTIELAKNISAINEVDLVILSGSNITEGDILSTNETGRIKHIFAKELTGSFAQLTLKLSDNCTISEKPTYNEVVYNSLNASACNIEGNVTAEEKAAMVKAINEGVSSFENYEQDLSVKLVTTLSTRICTEHECTLGSMAADAVVFNASRNEQFPLNSRAVLLSAGIFKSNATLTAPVSQKSLLDLLVDDEVFYKTNLSATQLKEMLEIMIFNVSSDNFPQLSGFHLFIDLNGDENNKVDILHILGSHLMYENIRFVENEKIYSVILPLNYLIRNGLNKNVSYPHEVTGIFLSEALASHFRFESSEGGPLLPPPLGERISYVLPPTQGLCENLIAITVCYTFLGVITVSSLLLLGYKIYSDRTSVHYVR